MSRDRDFPGKGMTRRQHQQPGAVPEQRTKPAEAVTLQRPPMPPQQTIKPLTPPMINMGLGLKLNP